MDRRQFLAGASGAAVALAAARPASAQTPSEDAKMRALLDLFWDEQIEEAPEAATALGLDTGPRAILRRQVSNYSQFGRAAMFGRMKTRLTRLRTVDRARLSPAAQIDYDVVAYQYERGVEGAERFTFGEGATAGFSYAPYSPYVVSQLSGPYQALPDFLDSKHPIQTADDAEAYITRLQLIGGAIDDSTASLKAEAARGILAPDFLLDSTMVQLAKLRDSDALATGLARKTAAAGLSGPWEARARQALDIFVRPAAERQRAAVEALRPQASHDPGVWRLPDGEAYYAGALAFQTTTDLKPDEVHRLGLEQVKALTAQIDPLLKAQGLTKGSVVERLAALNTRPDQVFANTEAGRAEILAYLNGRIADVRARLPRVFATLPPAPMEIVRVPPAIEDGAANGYAQGASLDGKRPGRFYINLKDTAEWPKFSLPTLAYHEGYPGHQWQGAIAQGSTEIPMIRRQGGGFAAYGEGWALYAEQLADELGVYDGDPLGRIGFLQSLLFRAVRLVVDTGMHAKRWSREAATDYMVQATGRPRGGMQREVDRYCVWPGQACSYKVGHNEWERLRAEAKARQGDRFDLKAFHEVLRRGRMPLVVLDRVVTTTLL